MEPAGTTAPVSRALACIRDDRNKALEDDLADLLSDAGYSTLNRVKETAPQRIGILAGAPAPARFGCWRSNDVWG